MHSHTPPIHPPEAFIRNAVCGHRHVRGKIPQDLGVLGVLGIAGHREILSPFLSLTLCKKGGLGRRNAASGRDGQQDTSQRFFLFVHHGFDSIQWHISQDG